MTVFVEPRPVKTYVAKQYRVSILDLPRVLPEAWGRVSEALAEQQLEPSDDRFVRYLEVAMPGNLLIHVGVPLDEFPADRALPDDLLLDQLPAGRYATTIHAGTYDRLVNATTRLMDWAAAQNLKLDSTPLDEGDRWGCRVETYLTDPSQIPNPEDWRTEISCLLAP